MLPRPLAELPARALRSVVGVLTDIDDTLTRDHALDPATTAMAACKVSTRAGFGLNINELPTGDAT